MSNNYYNFRERESVNNGKALLRIFISIIIMSISIFTIVFIINKITEIKILEKINLKPETHNSLVITTDTENGNSLFITDEKGLKFRKEDKTFAREEWIDKNGELFYFDTAGYGLNGELKKEGQVYNFENGKLKSIKRDTSYAHRADVKLYSSIESNQYLVWLEDEKNSKGFYPIKYKTYSDDFEDYLGTEYDIQYASLNMLKINMSNIYYLSLGKGTSYAGRLYRMRPGAVHKEVIGVGVIGYIVLSDDVVYYYDGERVIKANSWKKEELKIPSDEDVETSEREKASASEIIISETINVNDDIDIEELPKPDETMKIETIDVGEDKLKKYESIRKEDYENRVKNEGPVTKQIGEPTEKSIVEETKNTGKRIVEPVAVSEPGGIVIGRAPGN